MAGGGAAGRRAASGGARMEAVDDDVDDTDALIDAALKASTFIYAEMKQRIRDRDYQVDLEALKELKRAALNANVSFARYVKRARAREDRLLLELHLLRDASQRDRVDQEANRARVFNLIRSYRAEGASSTEDKASLGDGGHGLQLGPLRAQRAGASPSGGSKGGNGPTSSSTTPSGAHALQRAIATVGRIDASLAQLVPAGPVHVHGAGILARLQGGGIPADPEAPHAEPTA